MDGHPRPAPCLDALDHVPYQALGAESPEGRDALSLLSEPEGKLITRTLAWLCGFSVLLISHNQVLRRIKSWWADSWKVWGKNDYLWGNQRNFSREGCGMLAEVGEEGAKHSTQK